MKDSKSKAIKLKVVHGEPISLKKSTYSHGKKVSFGVKHKVGSEEHIKDYISSREKKYPGQAAFD